MTILVNTKHDAQVLFNTREESDSNCAIASMVLY